MERSGEEIRASKMWMVFHFAYIATKLGWKLLASYTVGCPALLIMSQFDSEIGNMDKQ